MPDTKRRNGEQIESSNTPILIGGSGSTGSTLLAAMLNRHPQVHCGDELSLLNKPLLYRNWPRFRQHVDRWLERGLPTDGYFLYFRCLPYRDRGVSAAAIAELVRQSDGPRSFLDALQRRCLREAGKTIWAEQTPSNCYCWADLLRLYPDARLLHPIRDGRDVVCSLRRRGFGAFEATSMWLYNTACAWSHRNSARYVEYHYEDLARWPEMVLRKLCRACGIEFDRAMLQGQPSDALPQPASAWNSTPAQPVSTRSVGRWKQDLSLEDYATFCSVRLTSYAAKRLGTPRYSALGLLREVGYPLGELPPSRPSVRSALLDHARRTKALLRRGHRPRWPLTTSALWGAEPNTGDLWEGSAGSFATG